MGAHDRKRLEQLRRYITRPAVSDEPVGVRCGRHVEFELKKPGATAPRIY